MSHKFPYICVALKRLKCLKKHKFQKNWIILSFEIQFSVGILAQQACCGGGLKCRKKFSWCKFCLHILTRHQHHLAVVGSDHWFTLKILKLSLDSKYVRTCQLNWIKNREIKTFENLRNSSEKFFVIYPRDFLWLWTILNFNLLNNFHHSNLLSRKKFPLLLSDPFR